MILSQMILTCHSAWLNMPPSSTTLPLTPNNLQKATPPTTINPFLFLLATSYFKVKGLIRLSRNYFNFYLIVKIKFFYSGIILPFKQLPICMRITAKQITFLISTFIIYLNKT